MDEEADQETKKLMAKSWDNKNQHSSAGSFDMFKTNILLTINDL